VGVAAAGGGKGRGKARLLSSARERVRSRESSDGGRSGEEMTAGERVHGAEG